MTCNVFHDQERVASPHNASNARIPSAHCYNAQHEDGQQAEARIEEDASRRVDGDLQRLRRSQHEGTAQDTRQGSPGGNVSALITELALEGERLAAFEAAWRWYGGPEPTADESAALRAEWEEGWKLALRAKRKTAA